MIRIAAFVAVAALMAASVQPLAAQAESLTVKVAGKSDAAVQADIRAAARKVCLDQYDFQLGVPMPEDLAQCERITARKAREGLDREILARAASNPQVASLSSQAKPGR